MSYVSKTWAVLEKELRTEFRARYAFNSVLLFCVTCTFVVSFALKGAVNDTRVVSALLWVILFFTAMTGLSRSFVKEEDRGTMNLLKLACEPGPLFLGKSVMNFLLLLTVFLIATPLFLVLMNVTLGNPAYYLATSIAALAGMAATCTLLSAMITTARAGGMLFPVLAFPVLLPVFWVAVDATDRALSPGSPWAHANLLTFLVSFAGAAIIGGGFLFEYVFSE